MKVSSIPVLAYHRVGPKEKIDAALFEVHLKTLAASGLPSLLPHELSAAKSGYVLTFDDGFAEVWTTIYPLLMAYRIKAVVFVIPGRTGTGPPRSRNDSVFDGTADSAHQQAAESKIPHPAFLRWSELAAMEASGMVQAHSHSYSHAMGWVSDAVQGFHLPPLGPGHWSLSQCTGGDTRSGIPLHPRGSALAHRLYTDDARLRDYLAAWLSRQQDFVILDSTKVLSTLTKALFAQTAVFQRSHGNRGIWETQEQRMLRTMEEIALARSALIKNLGKERDELCLPWGEYDETTLQCARKAGIRRIYSLEHGSNPILALQWMIKRFEPRPRGSLWLKSRLWIYRSRIRSEIYSRLSRRRYPQILSG